MPLVSVVIPSRDRAVLLERTLRCALGQVEVDLEVIAVDDGSSDCTKQMLEEVADPRLLVVGRDSPAGASAARNEGIATARGQWVGLRVEPPRRRVLQCCARGGD